jgi:hypothetical protein
MCNQKVRKKSVLPGAKRPFCCDATGGGATQQHAQTWRTPFHDDSKKRPETKRS